MGLIIRIRPFKEYRRDYDVYNYDYGWIDKEIDELTKQQLVAGENPSATVQIKENSQEDK